MQTQVCGDKVFASTLKLKHIILGKYVYLVQFCFVSWFGGVFYALSSCGGGLGLRVLTLGADSGITFHFT